MTTLYHYCPVDAFFSIVTQKKLRLTCINGLDDSNELNWTSRKVKGILNYLSSNYSRSDLAMLREQVLTSKITPYLSTFSENGDLLSQWLAYADEGTGVAIGFSRDYLPASDVVPMRNTSADSNLSLRRVSYADNTYDKQLEGVLTTTLNEMRDKDEKEKFIIATRTAHHIFGLSTFCKPVAFAEEKEWRMVHTPGILASARNETLVRGAISEIKQQVVGRRIQTYFEYDLAEEREVPAITEIVLGPKCQISHYDISIFLSLNGCRTTKVVNTKAGYR